MFGYILAANEFACPCDGQRVWWLLTTIFNMMMIVMMETTNLPRPSPLSVSSALLAPSDYTNPSVRSLIGRRSNISLIIREGV
jgi:hypothetical protein